MSAAYPVVAQRTLEPVPSKKFLGPKRTRSLDDIPQGGSNHRLVYRIGNDYQLDNGALTMDSDTVLEATHVSLVDISRDVQVPVRIEIPSKDADAFQLQVTFTCTVNDAVQVVRGGTHDLGSVLKAYVRKHRRIFELGLDYDLTEINLARRKISAQVTAYAMASPPVYLGVKTELESVEVLTPPSVGNYQRTLRDQAGRHYIDFDRQHRSQLMRSAATDYEQQEEIRSQRHSFTLDANTRDYQRYQFEQQREIGNNPVDALKYAYAAGEVSAKEFADEMLRQEQVEREYAQQELRRAQEWEQASLERGHEREALAETRRWEAERLDRDEQWKIEHKQIDLAAAERDREHAAKNAEREFAREELRRARERDHASLESGQEREALGEKRRWEAERLDRDEQWKIEHKQIDLAAAERQEENAAKNAEREFAREEVRRARERDHASLEHGREREALAETRRWEAERLDRAERWKIEHKQIDLAATERNQKLAVQIEIIRKLADRGAIDTMAIEHLVQTALSNHPEMSDLEEFTNIEVVDTTTETVRSESRDMDDPELREEDEH
ncbi:hypothetical protein [Nocardia bovistercoris]|uniref:Band 7 domain-containing protein n=1 Tax=Nocardia bovistercoris TaxID=2785916 RepID=A0A931IKM6_9NOCA|nr:hypothetical protein [Nocardia bovistercoris]MBH0781263.1 hypothetical protein [Nocardia bovistercoris]